MTAYSRASKTVDVPPQLRADILARRDSAGFAFYNEHRHLQYVFAVALMTDANGNISRVIGSTFDSTDVQSVAILSPSVLGYATIVCKKADCPAGAVCGALLKNKHIKGTRWEANPLGPEDDDSAYVIRSVPLLYHLPMHANVVTGDVSQTAVWESWCNESVDHQAWLEDISASELQREDAVGLFSSIISEEATYIHASYDPKWWPSAAPYSSLTIVNRDAQYESYYRIVSALMPNMPTTPPPAPRAPPAATTVTPPTHFIVKKDTTDEDERLAEMKISHDAFFATGDFNLVTYEVVPGSLRPPTYTASFTNILGIKKVDRQAKKLRADLMEVVSPHDEIIPPPNTSKQCHLVDMFGAMHLFQMILVKQFLQGSWALSQRDNPFGEATSSTIELSDFAPQNKFSSKLKKAREDEDSEEADELAKQHDTHRTRKRTAVQKVGHFQSWRDATSNIVNLLILSLACEDHAQAKTSIFYACFYRFAEILVSAPCTAWFEHMEHQGLQPQIGFYITNLAEMSLIKFAQAAQSNPVRNAIEVNQ